MTHKTILFVCPDNAVLGPMAEACMNLAGRGRIRAFSAGRTPAERLHPTVARLLRSEGFETEILAPKSWDIFALPHAPAVDMVVALSADVGGAVQPCWPGMPERRSWGISAEGLALQRQPVEDLFRQVGLAVAGFLSGSEQAGNPAFFTQAVEPVIRPVAASVCR